MSILAVCGQSRSLQSVAADDCIFYAKRGTVQLRCLRSYRRRLWTNAATFVFASKIDPPLKRRDINLVRLFPPLFVDWVSFFGLPRRAVFDAPGIVACFHYMAVVCEAAFRCAWRKSMKTRSLGGILRADGQITLSAIARST